MVSNDEKIKAFDLAVEMTKLYVSSDGDRSNPDKVLDLLYKRILKHQEDLAKSPEKHDQPSTKAKSAL